MKEPTRLQTGQMVEVIAARLSVNVRLHGFDGVEGKIVSFKQTASGRVAKIEVISKRDDAPSGTVDVPERALKPCGEAQKETER